MKISYISESIIPSRTANSIHVMKMCQAFAKNGHTVTLFAPKRKDTELLDNITIYEFYGVEECFQIEWVIYPLIKGYGVFYYGLTAALLSKKLNVDLVYGRSLSGCYFSALMKIPTYYEAHQPPSSALVKLLTKMILKSRNLRKIIVITESLKRIFIRSYLKCEHRFVVAPDGADPVDEVTKLNFSLDSNSKQLQVGYIGHLYKGRGIELIICIAEQCPWAKFHIIGGSNADIVAWQDKLASTNNILFYGYMSHPEAEKYRLALDVLLAPYQHEVSVQGGGNTAEWMSPLKLFEYMAAGKPIICSDLPVLREILVHNDNAMLCKPDCLNDWVNSLTLLKNNKSLRKNLGDNAKRDFEANYTWKARAEKVILKL